MEKMVNSVKNKTDNIKQILKSDKQLCFGLLIILFVTCFTTTFSWFYEPIGDDVITFFEGAISFYLDDVSLNIGDRITNPIQVIKLLKFYYMNWSGRMTGYSFLYFGLLFPKVVRAILVGVIFSSNIVLTLRIAYGKTRDALSSPLLFGLVFLVCYWYKLGCYYTYMWTLVSVYSFPIFLWLLYYNLTLNFDILKKRHGLIYLQLLGFVSGFSHEVLSLLLIIAVGTNWLRDFLQKKCKFTDLFRHSALGVGYLFCFFAPGNFHRTLQSHDAVYNHFIDRFSNEWLQNKSVLTGTKESELIYSVILFAAFAAIIIMIVKQDDIKKVILDRLGLIVSCGMFTFIWAATPQQPIYGEDLWILMVYSLLLSFAVKNSKYISVSNKSKVILTVIILIMFCIANFDELYSYCRVSYRRREIVNQAVMDGSNEVVVPKYEYFLTNYRYPVGDLNDQSQYNTTYYIKYYGVRLIV